MTATATTSSRTPNRRRTPRPRATALGPTVTLEGVLRLNPRGFGFVDVADAESCFVPPPLAEGFCDLDQVRLTVAAGDERRTATSVELVARARTTLAGRAAGRRRFIADPFTAAGAFTISGDDPRAGTPVVVSIGNDNTVTVTDVIDTDDVVRTTICVRHQLDPHDNTITAPPAAALAPLSETGRRRDLRDLCTITVDGDGSADLDDALSVGGIDPSGDMRVLVHIADVAAVITPGSALDVAAEAAATSVYLPGWTRHMLPTELSCDALSLNPGVERDTLTVELRIAADGTVGATDIYESRIRSNVRLSHRVAGALLCGAGLGELAGIDDPHASIPEITEPVTDTVRWLRTAAARLGVVRAARGGVSARRSDDDLTVDDEAPTTWGVWEHAAHDLIEELMVATNEAVGRWLAERNLPGLWRCHDRPDPDAVAELDEFAASVGVYAGFGPELTPASFGAFVAQLDTVPAASTPVWDLMAGLMPPASYRTAPKIHFGLGSDNYTHFTSPIRRYADLIVHRVIKAYLAGNRDHTGLVHGAELDALAAHINVRSRAAARAESQMRRHLTIAELAANPPAGKISVRATGVRRNALSVTTDTGVWGTLPFSALHGYWDADGLTVRSDRGDVITLGDRVEVRVDVAEPETLTLSFTQKRRR